MPTLSRELRNQLSRVTLQARTAAEAACRAALENLAVHEKDYRGHMSVDQRQLRNRLRARGRALGDSLDERSGKQEIKRLSEDAAYEHWHRLLFTRFLAENNMLHDDDLVTPSPVTLEDCEELAPEMGAKDGFELACRFASKILPGVFRTDDPVFELTLALNDQVELRGLLDSLPGEVFTADDSLGWTYQFWQTQRKAEVNASGKKIGADEISPVTQLFTEDYMVEFLLHNTLGAWHAGKRQEVASFQGSLFSEEGDVRRAVALPAREGLPGINWTYLRFVQDEPKEDSEAPSSLKTENLKLATQWRPAAGTFEGWPRSAAEITFLDPSMGSGHFPVFALPILARLRMEEENLSAKQAVYAVLRDNLHGLELDPRCTQIGAFNLALTAWKLAGYQTLPLLHIACCGLAPQAKLTDWTALPGDNDKLRRGMERLYQLFEQAPVLGSLINPRAGEGDLLVAAFHELQPLLEKALAQETKDDTAHEMAVTARGLAKAAEILAGQFTLVATNVPYLGRGKQDDILKHYCEGVYPQAKADLATCFLRRAVECCEHGGSSALVTPQSWLFQGSYDDLREAVLDEMSLNALGILGPRCFETISGEVVNAILIVATDTTPSAQTVFLGIDASQDNSPSQKAEKLQRAHVEMLVQSEQKGNPDCRISAARPSKLPTLAKYAEVFVGFQNGDTPRWVSSFWEQPNIGNGWEAFHATPERPGQFEGLDAVLRWEDGRGELAKSEGCRVQGREAWGRQGVLCRQTQPWPTSLYVGTLYDQSSSVLIPKAAQFIAPLYCFLQSDDFHKGMLAIANTMKFTNSTFVKVPFDLAHWQKVAAEKYPHGLPKPFSSDPTQWLFNGHPAGADQPLHVAVARLLGYRWPRQTGSSFPDCPALGPDGLESLADEDGIVCLPALNREQPAAARLRALLAAALGSFDEKKLLATAGAKAGTLEDWLRDECFEQHSKLFHHRPFLWHLWDGRKDGFSVLVNYHKLDHATLQKLTYTYLGNWIHDQESDAKADKPGAAERLGAAQALQAELAKILEGEAPYDIFVRWKPLNKQAIGWHPDLNDGVRLNIRPFMLARIKIPDPKDKDKDKKKEVAILRAKPNISWGPKADRGKEPERPKSDYPWFWCESEPATDPTGGKTFTGHRWNNVHLTLEMKKR